MQQLSQDLCSSQGVFRRPRAPADAVLLPVGRHPPLEVVHAVFDVGVALEVAHDFRADDARDA